MPGSIFAGSHFFTSDLCILFCYCLGSYGLGHKDKFERFYLSRALLLKAMCLAVKWLPGGSEVKNLPAVQETQETQV